MEIEGKRSALPVIYWLGSSAPMRSCLIWMGALTAGIPAVVRRPEQIHLGEGEADEGQYNVNA